jgi:2,3-bisphosphoglycerate-independent phosphoglycerate mutase
MRAAETAALLEAAGAAVLRAGFRLVPVGESHHLAIGPRASVDPDAPSPEAMLGRAVGLFEPRVEQHAFAHRVARDALERHEVNEVRRDLGRNGADLMWLWGPGGEARIEASFDAKVAGIGTDPLWRGLCAAASMPVHAPRTGTPAALLRALAQAVRTHRICFLHVRRATADALLRDRAQRVAGLSELDEKLVGPVADLVARRKARLLVLPEAARDTRSGAALPDAVPALLWGAGVRPVSERPFTEEGAAAAGEPLSPGHGLLAYVRHV